MSGKKTSEQKRSGLLTRAGPKSRLLVAVVLSMFAAGAMLAYSGAFSSAFKQKGGKRGTVSTASMNSTSPSKEYIYAGGRLVATEEASSGGGCTPPAAPALTTSVVNSVITLNWNVPAGTDAFEVERTPRLSVPFAPVATLPGTTTSWPDTNMVFGGVNPDGSNNVVTYIYRVIARIGQCSTPSNKDWATNINFADVLTPQQTSIKGSHITELRVGVNSVWKAADQTPDPITWADPPGGGVAGLAGFQIKKAHVDELRAKLNQAMDAIQPGYSALHTYLDPTLVQHSTPVKAQHLTELRNRVK